MRAGSLDRRITLKSRAKTQSDTGEIVESFTTLATVWARWAPAKGAERVAAGQVTDTAAGAFEIRYRDDVTAILRIEWESKEYRVIGEPEEIGRREGLRLHVERVEA